MFVVQARNGQGLWAPANDDLCSSSFNVKVLDAITGATTTPAAVLRTAAQLLLKQPNKQTRFAKHSPHNAIDRIELAYIVCEMVHNRYTASQLVR